MPPASPTSWPTWLRRRATATTSNRAVRRPQVAGRRNILRLAACLLLSGVLIGGCGGSGSASGPTLVAALGDSITAGSPAYDPDPGVRETLGGGDPRSQYEFWAKLRLGDVRFRNCGVFGERTDQIARRFDGCTRGARAVIIQGGINDIAQGRSVQDAATNIDGMVRTAKGRGLGVVLVEVLPWTNGYPAAAPRIRRLNRLIHALGAREGVAVLPWYRALEDPRRPGRFRRSLTADGDHPNVRGYRVLGGLVRLPPAG
jgi:lysophospholipase L1-like esterase